MKKKTWRLSLREEYYGMPEVELIRQVSIEIYGKPREYSQEEVRFIESLQTREKATVERNSVAIS